ncbi:MAG: response regulator transcription factor [Acidobacteria bacterium]|nr:response regulator transcription factor [Acidobacteriota bacterium]
MENRIIHTVAVCDTEPIAIEGLRSLVSSAPDLHLVAAEGSLVTGMEVVRNHVPSVAVIDKAFGVHAVMDWVRSLRSNGRATCPMVWGVGLAEAEALRLVQAGAVGVIRKSASLGSLLECLRSVASGSTWMEECLLGENNRSIRGHRANLTGRELQVLELVEKGLRNKDIAQVLGIQAGTVKIHMKHIFEKTGVRGRYGLAISGLKEKGELGLPTM